MAKKTNSAREPSLYWIRMHDAMRRRMQYSRCQCRAIFHPIPQCTILHPQVSASGPVETQNVEYRNEPVVD